MHNNRTAIRDLNNRLDAVTEHQRIIANLSMYEFPWLITRALEFALFRTYAVPSISQLLADTGQFTRYGQRRYDDTSLIIAEISENGYDSERGRAALRRMNRLHGRFDISNDDYLYVLSTFIFEPHRWVERFGWRTFTKNEQDAGFIFWCEVGKRMNIQHIPATIADYEAFNRAYEREHFRYSGSNAVIGEATVQIFINWYPAPTRPFVREAIYALMDDPLREAFGFPKASTALTGLLANGLKLRGRMIRHLFPPRTMPYRVSQSPNRTYPFGYEIERLGPPDMPPDRVVGKREGEVE